MFENIDAELIWKTRYLYLRDLYVGRVAHLTRHDGSVPSPDKTWRAFIQTGPHEKVVDWFPSEDEAKTNLIKAVSIALTR